MNIIIWMQFLGLRTSKLYHFSFLVFMCDACISHKCWHSFKSKKSKGLFVSITIIIVWLFHIELFRVPCLFFEKDKNYHICFWLLTFCLSPSNNEKYPSLRNILIVFTYIYYCRTVSFARSLSLSLNNNCKSKQN